MIVEITRPSFDYLQFEDKSSASEKEEGQLKKKKKKKKKTFYI